MNPSWRVSLLCFLGMKDADSGSRHFLFPRSFCLPDMTLGLFRGTFGSDRGVDGWMIASNDVSDAETDDESRGEMESRWR